MDKPVSQMTPNEWVYHNAKAQALSDADHTRRFEATMAPFRQTTQAAAPQASAPQYFTPGGASDARDGIITGIFAPLFACIFKATTKERMRLNNETQAQAMPRAFLHTMDTLWVWKTWAFAVLYWVVSGACIYFWRGAEAMQGDPATGFTTGRDVSFQTELLVLHFLLLVPAILCRTASTSILVPASAGAL